MTRIVRVAAVADIHVGTLPNPAFQSLLTQVTNAADVLLMCGDLTHHGLAEEAEVVAKGLGQLRVPVLAVLGNHDHHGDQKGIGFAGVKGFATGFGRR